MSDLPPWPDAKPEHLGLANSTYWEAYERARADAAMARLRLAEKAMHVAYGYLSNYQGEVDGHFHAAHDALNQTLEAIGELP